MSRLEDNSTPLEQPVLSPNICIGSYAGLCLPDFWSGTPASLFLSTESKLHFCHHIGDAWVRPVGDPPCQRPPWAWWVDVLEFTDCRPPLALKQCLFTSHQLLKLQCIELLFKTETLGTRKPSEFLSLMLKIFSERGRTTSSLPLLLTTPQGSPQPFRWHWEGPHQVGRWGELEVGLSQPWLAWDGHCNGRRGWGTHYHYRPAHQGQNRRGCGQQSCGHGANRGGGPLHAQVLIRHLTTSDTTATRPGTATPSPPLLQYCGNWISGDVWERRPCFVCPQCGLAFKQAFPHPYRHLPLSLP